MYKYVKFYKPFEVLCQFTPVSGRQTLKDYIPVSNVYPAGRLDYRSEGLLFLTDDGLLIQRLTDPRFNHAKTYLVQVEGEITPQAIDHLNHQIVLSGIQTKVASVVAVPDPDLPPRSVPVRAYHPKTWLKFTLFEGKKHQVRRMTAAVGYPTLRLVRIAISNLTLGDLQPGEWRFLTPDELSLMKSALESHR